VERERERASEVESPEHSLHDHGKFEEAEIILARAAGGPCQIWNLSGRSDGSRFTATGSSPAERRPVAGHATRDGRPYALKPHILTINAFLTPENATECASSIVVEDSPTYHPSVRRAVLGLKSSLARPPLVTLPSLYIEAQEACPAIAIP
jgi:hypothetical protein